MATEKRIHPAVQFNGALIIDKPPGMTSHDVVSRMRRILRTKKIGHTGTLDPFATGVMVMLVGKATRLARFLDKDEKSYEAVVRFGFETDTGDREGSSKEHKSQESGVSTACISERQSERPAAADGDVVNGGKGHRTEDIPSHDKLIERVNEVLPEFTGEIQQIPPMYSAKKVKGKKLYELARQGIKVEREPVTVNIGKLSVRDEITPGSNPEKEITGPDEIVLDVTCSAGTYIRTLAEDIGRRIGIGCHLSELRRSKAGRFGLEQAITLEELEQLAEAGEVSKQIVAMAEIVGHLPARTLDNDELRRISHGLKIATEIAAESDAEVRLIDEEGRLVAIGQTDRNGNIQPRAVFEST